MPKHLFLILSGLSLTILSGCASVSQSITEIERERVNHPAMTLWQIGPSSSAYPLTDLGGGASPTSSGCNVCAH